MNTALVGISETEEEIYNLENKSDTEKNDSWRRELQHNRTKLKHLKEIGVLSDEQFHEIEKMDLKSGLTRK